MHVQPVANVPVNIRMRAQIEALAAAKSAQRAVEANAIYHPDIELIAPSLGGYSRGRGENLRALEQFFALFPDYQVELEHWTYGDRCVACWGIARMTPNTSLLGLSGNGEQVQQPVFITFEFRDGQIVREEFFIDLAGLCAQAGISTDAALHVLHAIRSKEANS